MKINGILDSQSQTTDVHYHFHIIILCGPAALASVADIMMKDFLIWTFLPAVSFALAILLHQSFQRLALRSSPRIPSAFWKY